MSSNEIKSLGGADTGILTISGRPGSHPSAIDAAVLQQLNELVDLLASEHNQKEEKAPNAFGGFLASVATSKNDLVTDPTKLESALTSEILVALAPALAELKGVLKQLPQGLGSGENQAPTPGTGSKEEQGPNLSDLMGSAVFYLQQFEQNVAKAQSDQDKIAITIGQALVASALDNQKNIADQLAEIAKKQQEAKHRPWWSILLQVVAAIVGPIVSVLTMGAGAAVAVVLIAAFMASPLYGKLVNAIASGIAADLKGTYYNEDIKKGMSPEDAKTDSEQRSQAVANVIASVVVIIAVAVVSFGVGGVESVAQGATESAEEGAEAAGEAAGETELQWSGKQGARIAGMEAVQTIASTNLPMQIMMTDPTWVKKNHDLALILDAIAEIALALVSMAASGKCMTGNKGSQYLMNNMLGLASKLNKINTVVQTASSSYGVYSGVEQVKLLNDQAALTRVLAGLQKKYVEIQAFQQMNMERESLVNQTASSITKEIDEMKGQIMALAGKDFDAVNSVIGH